MEADGSEEVETADDNPGDSSFMKLRGLPFLADSDADEDDAGADTDDTTPDGNRIVHLLSLQKLLDRCCVCRQCQKGQLILREAKHFELAPHMNLTCDRCGYGESETLSQKQIKGRSHFFDVNRKAVLGMRLIGGGHSSLKTLCSVMDMPPPMSKYTFDCH